MALPNPNEKIEFSLNKPFTLDDLKKLCEDLGKQRPPKTYSPNMEHWSPESRKKFDEALSEYIKNQSLNKQHHVYRQGTISENI